MKKFLLLVLWGLSLVSCNSSVDPLGSISLPPTSTAVANNSLFSIPKSLQVSATSSNVALDAESLFDWAESQYSLFFSTHEISQISGVYTFRYYKGTGNYLGVSNDQVYVLGPISQGQLMRVGALSDFYCSVISVACKQNSIANKPFLGNVLLGSPTSNSMMVSCLTSGEIGGGYLSWGSSDQALNSYSYFKYTDSLNPGIFTISGLEADKDYYYQFNFLNHTGEWRSTPVNKFHTARPPGAPFSFTIQADSHLDGNSDLATYQLTLSNIKNSNSDFHIDLGDTFMTEKFSTPLTNFVSRAPDFETVNNRYRYERNNYGALTSSVPLFLVNGNHDGELGWLLDGSPQNNAVWSTLARQKYFLNPAPSGFYSTDTISDIWTGQRSSWFAWTWGDALFVALDPYWNTIKTPTSDPWTQTLGTKQYSWLSDTLKNSTAKYKFIFIHNIIGGLIGEMRGGIEAAPYFEWGGKNLDGTDVFNQKRPGWAMPLHQLFVKNGVTAVFHGHDHLYAKQDLDGIVYQEVPQPSAINFSNYNSIASAYSYKAGTILGSSGFIKVTVGPKSVQAQYIRTWLAKDESSQRKNAEIADVWQATKP
jgi:hypothetical protein